MKKNNMLAEVSDIDEVEYALMPTISIPELKCSYFLGQSKGEESKIMVKIEEGRLKNIVVSLCKFKMTAESDISFNYIIEHNPYKKIPSVKTLELFIKKCVMKIITDSVKSINKQKDTTDENRDSNLKISVKK